MDKEKHSLLDILKSIGAAQPERFSGYCRGCESNTQHPHCPVIGSLYVTGVDFYKEERRIRVAVERGSELSGECEQRLCVLVADAFGCDGAELVINGGTSGTPSPTNGGGTSGTPSHTNGGGTSGTPSPTNSGGTSGTPSPTNSSGTSGTPSPTNSGGTSGTPSPTNGGGTSGTERLMELRLPFISPTADKSASAKAQPTGTAGTGGMGTAKSGSTEKAKPGGAGSARPGAAQGSSGSGSATRGAGRAKRQVRQPRERVRAGDFARSMKGIDIADGEYFIKNPDVVCGVKIAEKPAPIGGLTAEGHVRAVVRGEIVILEFRPVRNGEVFLLECGITDCTGSIAVKMFIPAEFLKYVKPRLNKKDEILVYGEVQYDAYLREPALYAVDINQCGRTQRTDDAPVRRVELHMHTQMSALDAVTPAEELIKKAASFGHRAVAITDHGGVQAFPDAYAAGKKYNIKIIYGVEAYLDTSDICETHIYNGTSGRNGENNGNSNNSGRNGDSHLYHIILLVKNYAGLRNLYKLVSKSHIDYFYKRPRMPRREIEAHREGLIIGSACEAGELFSALLNKKSRDEILEIAAFYDYYEIQPIGNNEFLLRENKAESIRELQELNAAVASLGAETGKPVVATCDVHFADMSDEIYRRILMAGQGYQDADAQPPLFFRTTAEMLGEFEYLGAEKAYETVVTNTNIIDGWIEDGIKPIPDGTFTPEIEGAGEELARMVMQNAAGRYGDPLPAAIRERIDMELDIIISKNFAAFYIIAHKLVKKSNEEGYIVGSRGSVGASLVAVLAGITEVNPLPPHYLCAACQYIEFSSDPSISSGFDLPDKLCPRCGCELQPDGQDIMFEIFIGAKGAEKAPDIDFNFSGEYQLKAHKYAEELFGESNVFKAGTIATIAGKTAYGFVKKYLESKGLYPGRIEEERLTAGCTGVKRTTGQHPGGVVVIPHDREIYEFTPVQRPADAVEKDIITTHFDFNALKHTILKLDMLGHDDPTVIRMLEELTGVRSDTIKMNDPQIISLFTGTRALGVTPDEIGSPVGTIGLPEFGTRFIRQMLTETRPKSFSDLLQISGLSHGTNVWLNNAQELIRNGVCTISDVIGTRESLVLYLMHKGLDQLAAFNIMELVRTKNCQITPEQEANMRERGVPDWYIDSCRKIEYLFTKAHATAYVQMAYKQAWYKIHTPLAFYAAYFTVRADEFDAETMTRGAGLAKSRLDDLNAQGREINAREQKLQTILEVVVEMYARGMRFLPVDLYRSDAKRFIIEGDSIRPPLQSLPGLGAAAADSICEARTDKPFVSVDDMAIKAKISKAVVSVLRDYGALDGMANESQISLYDLLA